MRWYIARFDLDRPMFHTGHGGYDSDSTSVAKVFESEHRAICYMQGYWSEPGYGPPYVWDVVHENDIIARYVMES